MAVIDTFDHSEFNPEIEIVEQEEDRGMARMLFVKGICQSALWLDPSLRGEPVLKYARRLREVVSREFEGNPPKEALIMGGAGLEAPRFLLRDIPDIHITVVEVDPVMQEVAEKYFFLEDLTYGGKLDLIIDDAAEFIAKAVEDGVKKYDLIIDDAFCGISAETALLTDTACERVRTLLTEKGVYIINLVTALSGSDSWPLLMERDIILRFFESMRAYPAIPDKEQESIQNCIVASSGFKKD